MLGVATSRESFKRGAVAWYRIWKWIGLSFFRPERYLARLETLMLNTERGITFDCSQTDLSQRLTTHHDEHYWDPNQAAQRSPGMSPFVATPPLALAPLFSPCKADPIARTRAM